MRRYERCGSSRSGPAVKVVSLLVLCTFLFAANINAQFSTTICSATTPNLNYIPAGDPSGLTYTWASPTVTPGGAVTASPNSAQTAVTGTLTNNTAAPASVLYTVSRSNATTFSLTVTVNPTPVLSSSIATTSVCSAGTFSYQATSATGGTTFSWDRPAATSVNIAVPSNNGAGATIIEALTNTSINPTSAVYNITLSASGCSNVQPITVNVNPLPTLNTSLTPADVCSGLAFTYNAGSGQAPNVSFSWTRAVVAGNAANAAASGAINETLTNSSLSPVQVDYIFALHNNSTGCDNSQTVTTHLKPVPTINNLGSAPSSVCSGSAVNYTPTAALGGTSFDWSRAAVPNVTPNSSLGSGSINEVLANTSATAVNATYTYLLSNNGCSITQNIVVAVNPLPTLSSSTTPGSICSGSSFNYTATSGQAPNVNFSWTRAVVAGITNPAGGPTAGNISEALINSTNGTISVVYSYTLSNTTTGCTNIQNFGVPVNPIPTVSSYALTVCNNNGFLSVPSGAPVGTTYTWITPTSTPGGAFTSTLNSQSVETPYVNESFFHNVTASTADVLYTVRPNLQGCTGSNFNITVSVSPGSPATIDLQSSLTPPAVCSGLPFVYTPTSNAPSPTFAWQRLPVTGISNAGATGNGGINETLINTLFTQVTTSYSITVSSGGCSNVFAVSAQINPGTTLNSTLTPAAICSNTLFNYTPTSNTATQFFNWTRNLVAGISNNANVGNGAPNETLTNTTTAPITVGYSYTLITASGCTSTPQTVNVVVNPTPTLSSSLTATAVCSGGVLSYVPTSATAGTLFSWTRAIAANINNAPSAGFNSIGETLTNTSLVPATATYVYSLTANACSNSQTVTGVVNPLPSVTNQITSICSNASFVGTPNAATVPAGTTYAWNVPVIVAAGAITGGISATGQSAISHTLINSTINPATAFYDVTPTANGCSGTNFSVQVTVNPVPVISDVTIGAVCSGSAFLYTPPSVPSSTAYTWSSPVITPPGSLTGGSAQSNQATITQVLSASGISSTTAQYTIQPIASGCPGATFVLTVPVNPVPQISSSLTATICSGNNFVTNPTPIPAGTTFTWSAPTTTPFGAVPNAVSQATPIGSISQLLTNTTTAAAQSVYNIVPVTGSCAGAPFTLTVTINPSTQLNSGLTAPDICSNTTFHYSPGSNTPSTVSYNWTRTTIAGISNTARSSTGDPNEVLINTTAAPVSVSYSYTLSTTGGCSNTETVVVIVNPTPKLSSALTPPDVCSGVTTFSYTPSSATSGTTFTWSRPTVSFISNGAGSGTNDPLELLTSTSLNQIPVTYNYTLSANSCSNTEAVVVNVNPVPVVTDQTASICSNTSFTVAPSGVPASTKYTWGAPVSNPVSVVTGGSAGTLQNNISQLLLNGTISAATNTYTVTPIASGCSGNAFSITVTVKPTPVGSTQTITAVCSGTNFSFVPSGLPAGTQYSWPSPVLNPAGGLTGGSSATLQNTIGQTLSSSNNVSNTAVYEVTPTANGCIGGNFFITVPVNPVPVVSNQVRDICSGTSFTVIPTPVPVGTTYTWTTPVHTPVGSVTGSSSQATPQTSISQLLTNATTAGVQSVYTVTPTTGACVGSTFNITVGINPGTQLNLSLTPPGICSNTTFSYAAASNTPGTTFQWARSTVAGISNAAGTGSNNPLEPLVNITTQSITVTYAYTLTTPAGCTNNQTVSVEVKPTPSFTSLLNPAAICSGTTFNYTASSTLAGTTYSWTRTAVPFISNASAGNTTSDPAEILVNTSVGTVTTAYDYVLTANGCSNNQTVTVTVNPTPVVSNQTTASCSNTVFSFTPTNVPASTKYTWTAPVISPSGSITGSSAQAGGLNAISQLLVNQTLNAAVARYTVTPTAGACSGAAFFVDVTLNPAASVSNQTLSAVCSGTTFSYAPSNVPAGTVYTWTSPSLNPSNGLSGGGAESVNKQTVSQTLSSTNNVQNTAVYAVTPSTNGCTGTIFTLTVPVNPTPIVNNMNDTICTGSSFSLVASPVPANTNYAWGTPQTFPFGSLIGTTAQASPAPTISQTLINTTSNTAQALYTVVPSANGCVGNSFTLAVVVGAVLPAIPAQTATVCSGSAFNATPAAQPANTTYTWGTPVVAPAGSVTGISAVNTPQATVSQLLDNLVTNNTTVVYTVSAKNTGCISNSFTATITVLPVPRAIVTGNAVICRYPTDTLTVTFTGQSPWGFTYIDDNNISHAITGVGSAPYKLVVPSTTASSRKLAFLKASHNGCVNNKDTTYFSQVINSLPVGVIHSLHGNYICKNIADTMFVTSPESLTYDWMRNGVSLGGPSSVSGFGTDDTLVTNVGGRYNVMMTNQFGCKDTATVQHPLIFVTQPVLRLKFDTYCIDTKMNLTNITDTNLVGPTQWQWNFDNGATASGFHSSVTFTTGGDHHIQLKATQLFCPTYPTSIDTTVNINFPIPGVTMPSMSAYKGLSTPVSVRNIANYKYRWTPPFGINNPDSANTFFNNQNTQQYVINLISPAGCVTKDSLLIRVFDDKLVDIMIPKSFTPNGDGINDILYPYLSGIKEFKYFKVYNRYNQLMFETKNYDVGWNGTVTGTPQPMAIYIWVAVGVANDGSMVEKKGQVLLLR